MSDQKDTRFEEWHAHRVNLSGGQRMGGKGARAAGFTYTAGPGKGRTEGQLLEQSKALWNSMNESQRTAAHAAVTPARNTAPTNPRTAAPDIAPGAAVDPQDAEDSRIGRGLGQSGDYVRMMRERAHPPAGSPASIYNADGTRRMATMGGRPMNVVLAEDKARQRGETAPAPAAPAAPAQPGAPKPLPGSGPIAKVPMAGAPVTTPLTPGQLVAPKDIGHVAGTVAMNHGKRLFMAPAPGSPAAPAPAPPPNEAASIAQSDRNEAIARANGTFVPDTSQSGNAPVVEKPAGPAAVEARMNQVADAGLSAGAAVTRRSTQGIGVMDAPTNPTDPAGTIAGAMNRAWKNRGSQPVTKPSIEKISAAE